MPKALQDLTDRQFGKWKVLCFSHTRRLRNGKPLRYWACVCECGTEVSVNHSELLFGRSTCCRSCHATIHGHKKGGNATTEYLAWSAMKHRCSNPSNPAWKNYGGRGIAVCERWLTFENFLADMGRRPAGLELDRIDNDGDYEPGNVRWTTRSENIKNTRLRKRNDLGQFTGVLE